MSATLLRQNSINNLNNFLADVTSAGNTYYFWVGKTIAWPNDAAPPTANQSYQEAISVYHDLMFGKLLSNSNVSAICNYTQWTTNTVYAQYSTTDQNLFNENFYVTTPDMSVYKCIDNNNGVPSIAQPSLKLTSGCFKTSDGYTWKYMFTIPSASNSAFTTNYFIPVTPNTSVVAGAVPGTIDAIRLPIQGTNYQGFNTGTIKSVISPTQIQIANTATQTDQFYTGCSLYLKSGLGAGQISNIVNYIGASQIATVNPPFQTYINMQITNNLGTISNGQIISQAIENVAYLYSNGYFNIGDQVYQTDTGLSGYVYGANSSTLSLALLGNTTIMSQNLVVYVASRTSNLGVNAFCTIAGNTLITNSSSGSANLLTTLAVGQYIRLGSHIPPSGNGFYNTRRVTSITNSSYANVDTAWAITSNTQYGDYIWNVNSAVFPTSVAYTQANAVITQTNLTALTFNYSNTIPLNTSFTLGETVKEYANNGGDLSANGIVAFVNTTTVILTGVQGSWVTGANQYGKGQTSNTVGTVTNIVSYPNITLSGINGTFQTGIPVLTYNLSNTLVSVGNATPISYMFIPSSSVQYIIGPNVTITGDGANAQAYCVVNTASGSIYNITNVIPLNVGSGYTYANVSIAGSGGYGSGAVATPVISPPAGHGSDAISELGASKAGISITISNALNELFKFPNYGSYRRVGILKNPQFQNITLNISTTNRNNLTINNISGSFSNSEIVLQGATNAAGVFISGNSTMMQLANISGTFVNSGITLVRGLISNATANVSLVNPLLFSVNGNQSIYDYNTTANGQLTLVVNSSQIQLSSVGGKINSNDTIYDPSINTYANVTSIYAANNTLNVSTTYGQRFNQTARLTLVTNTGAFILGERVVQPLNAANGLIIDTAHELDVAYTATTGVLTSGVVLTDTTTSGNAIVTFANSTYMKLTAVQGSFNSGDAYSFLTGSGTINKIYSVLTVGDVLSPFQNNNNAIQGLTSGSIAVANIAGAMSYPDLVKNTGQVLYVNDVSPFTLTANTQETFQTYISF